jgi:hypothetical protein
MLHISAFETLVFISKDLEKEEVADVIFKIIHGVNEDKEPNPSFWLGILGRYPDLKDIVDVVEAEEKTENRPRRFDRSVLVRRILDGRQDAEEIVNTVCSDSGRTALHEVIYDTLFLEKGKPFDKRRADENIEIIKILKSKGADLQIEDGWGDNPVAACDMVKDFKSDVKKALLGNEGG